MGLNGDFLRLHRGGHPGLRGRLAEVHLGGSRVCHVHVRAQRGVSHERGRVPGDSPIVTSLDSYDIIMKKLGVTSTIT